MALFVCPPAPETKEEGRARRSPANTVVLDKQVNPREIGLLSIAQILSVPEI